MSQLLATGLFTAAQAGLVPASGGGATNILHADGSWGAPSGIASTWFDTILTPPQIASTVGNWNVGTLGVITLVLVTSDASRQVSGLVGGTDGKIVALLNINATGGNTPLYLNEDAGATAANRFHNSGGGTLNGGSSGCVIYYYHGAASRWRSLAVTA